MKRNEINSELAARWQCSPRTIRRMKACGVNVHNAAEVIDYVTHSRTATAAQLEAAHREIVAINESEIAKLTTQPDMKP